MKREPSRSPTSRRSKLLRRATIHWHMLLREPNSSSSTAKRVRRSRRSDVGSESHDSALPSCGSVRSQDVPLHRVCWCGVIIPQDLNEGKPRKYCRPDHAPRTYVIKDLTVAQYNAMVSRQCGYCAICNKPERDGRALSADRCPRTSTVRELICGNCNKALTAAKDDPAVLDSAAKYLVAHSATQREVFIPSPRSSACPSTRPETWAAPAATLAKARSERAS